MPAVKSSSTPVTVITISSIRQRLVSNVKLLPMSSAVIVTAVVKSAAVIIIVKTKLLIS